MKVALIKDSKVYDNKLLGLTLRERIKKTLERAGFVVEFFNDGLTLREAESYLFILEPVLILERDLRLEGKKALISDNSLFGYLFEGDFRNFFSGDLLSAIERYISMNSIEKQEVWAVKVSEENLKKAEKLLLESLVKSEKTGLKPAYYDGVIARVVNRKISLRISKFLAGKNVTPNQITVFSFLLSLVAAMLYLINNYLATLVAGIIVQIHNILDCSDGEIARLKFMESSYGAWLDGVLDRYADFVIIFSITFSLSQLNQSYWILGFLAAFAALMIAYTGDKFVAAYKTTYKSKGIPITRDVRLFIIFLGSIFNQLAASLILIAVLGNAECLRRIFEIKVLNSETTTSKGWTTERRA
ncbi:CDP-alcohol phosphatidyltransferase [Ferroglobus placidus DSM 10642]|uniref:CDP-alcohol phosphatidyltransferase n=1 Tax=Ferroglobus placidus (strain DSM 10642 / AEDII12DO) TaxID=589924 RepID=D3RX14_FERPA|nr:CDP-alcohol phosphatidyltransferase family protein [Ferroglobus placidus]ADC65027.1 CDP-alcohol phosphatidyltransferase [Ferroglobus placidus DSM 10642]